MKSASCGRADCEQAARDVAYYQGREVDIIATLERVCDGGQYRADIVSAIERIKRERDEALFTSNRLRAELDEARAEAEGLRELIAVAQHDIHIEWCSSEHFGLCARLRKALGIP